MKNLFILTLLVVSITSCSKDAFEPSQEEFFTIKKSEIMVTVSRMDYSYDGCGSNCGTGNETVAYLPDARVQIYPGVVVGSDQPVNLLVEGRTDTNGRWLAADLEPGQYTVVVQSSYGKKTRLLYTQLNKRSSIEFSF